MASVEYQSAAIVEGWAQFAAGAVFNHETQTTGAMWAGTGDCLDPSMNSGIVQLETTNPGGGCEAKNMENRESSGVWPGHATGARLDAGVLGLPDELGNEAEQRGNDRFYGRVSHSFQRRR